MWFKVAPQALNPMFQAVGMYYRGAQVLVRVVMRENDERFAEVQDDRGNIVRTFINGLPGLLEFDLSSSATHFRLELPDRSIVQPLRPTAIDERDLVARLS
jgi:hypothetical protein